MKTGIPKIAVVIPRYGLVGGGEKFVVELTERIARDFPCEMHVFANQWKKHSDLIRFHKIPIVSFPKYLTTVSFAWFAQRKIQEMGFDIVHAHERLFAADIVSLHSIPHRLWVRDVRQKRFLSLFDRATIEVEKAIMTRLCFCPFRALPGTGLLPNIRTLPVAWRSSIPVWICRGSSGSIAANAGRTSADNLVFRKWIRCSSS